MTVFRSRRWDLSYLCRT